jgi:ATP-dependent helicase/nuclease subunit A
MYVASTRAKDCLVVSTYEGALGDRRAWGSLDDCIHGVAELEVPDVRAEKEREKLRLAEGEWEEAKEKIKEGRDVVAAPSYAVETVTSLAKKDLEVPEWRRGSYGMAWGRAVHRMLEVVGKWDADGNGDGSGDGDNESKEDNTRAAETDQYHLKLIRLAENVLVAEEISLDKRTELVKLVLSITKSEFWDRAKKAEKKLFEVPFSILTDKETVPTILTGAIDLAFLESGGWVIADFKTDDVGTALQSFVDYYTPQVQIYCRHWAEITRQPIKEAGLYFTSINKWIEIEWK